MKTFRVHCVQKYKKKKQENDRVEKIKRNYSENEHPVLVTS